MSGERRTWSLIVKADDADTERIERMVIERGFGVLRTYATDREVIVHVVCDAEDDLTNMLNDWMTADAGMPPPFPDGSLLYWRELP